MTVRDLCESFGIELDADRQRAIEEARAAALEALRATIKSTRRWPVT
jgi:hypothetical protein